ncbi:hypothetical protein D8674_024761 [Pyrus ussuriensis x Pyrus communis]|uniref:Phytocyanin domain-containing protein n=1 Tax=Pyrus ussuriensis x Pyrus communis TaxID=2448454 RepID=A0A5N5H3U8_9ROSA|nr:hypothetical protein D8674_024761 [Pyrus ussuriensis x Pyrus communis]
MATSQLFLILAILAIFAPSILATDYVAGDDKGWTINFDYQAWARGKMFFVGDNLVFNYPKGAHNVFKVNGTGFQECSAPLDSAINKWKGCDQPCNPRKKMVNLWCFSALFRCWPEACYNCISIILCS